MVKRIVIILFVICLSSTLYAAIVSEHDVADMALLHLRKLSYSRDVEQDMSTKGTYNANESDLHISKVSITGEAILYAVEYSNGGWALISSDSKIRPILAYSEHGSFPSIDDMPEGMQWLFSEYEEIMKYAAADSLNTKIHADWSAIKSSNNQEMPRASEPVMLNRMDYIKWGQGKGNDGSCNRQYNILCPTDYPAECGHTYVGCSATALGQILWYYQWPNYASVPDTIFLIHTTHQANWPSPLTKRDSYYDFTQMPTSLSSDSTAQQERAIASLLRDCGYSLRTYYGETGSPALTHMTPLALMNNFSYKCNPYPVLKNNVGDTAMISVLKNEIDNNRPVFYYGFSRSASENDRKGHAFIIYGYKDDQFYINWGHNGSFHGTLYSIGFFGIEYSFSYNYDQGAYIGIEPDYCSVQKINPAEQWGNSFAKSYIGNIEIGNRIMTSNSAGTITASNSIRLSHGFRIQTGANVHISINGTPCDSREIENRQIPSRQQKRKQTEMDNFSDKLLLHITPNPVKDIMNIHINEELSYLLVYNLNGQCMLQTNQTDIDVSSLPQGMYILRAITSTGDLKQAKFIKE